MIPSTKAHQLPAKLTKVSQLSAELGLDCSASISLKTRLAYNEG